ncbi:MAG: WD40 repeat domain-containing protein [Candidatus Thorarchaeota archaeon]|nr:WD40 repeat domain-containing protein [Candidatus Thorarchaeota archaeon]
MSKLEQKELTLFLKPKVLKPAAQSADQITRRLAMNKIGRMIAAAHQDRTIRLYDVRNGEEIQRLKDDYLCTSMAFSPRGDILASGGVDRILKFWDIRTGECIARLEGHSYPVLSIAFSPDGSRVVTSSGDTTMIVWDVGSRSKTHQLRGHSLYVVSCDWDPRGDRIVSGGVDGIIGLWDAKTGNKTQWIKEHRTAVHSVRFSTDGAKVVSTSSDLSAIVWDATGPELKMIQTLRGHSEEVRTASFSSDGSMIASGSSDKCIYVWMGSPYAISGEGKTTSEVDGIEWFPDQSSFVSCEGSGAIIRWDVVQMESMLQPFRALLREIEADSQMLRREELTRALDELRGQYDPEVLQDRQVFYLIWQCKKALGLLKGKPKED